MRLSKSIESSFFLSTFALVEETRKNLEEFRISLNQLRFFFRIMHTKLMRVVQQGEAFAVLSQKSENGQIMKCNIVLQEMGGKYENQYVATMLGNLAQCKFYPGDVVAVTMRFSTREYNGQVFQDILLTDLYKFN